MEREESAGGRAVNPGAEAELFQARILELQNSLQELQAKHDATVREADALRARVADADRARAILDALLDIVPAWVFVKDQAHRYHCVSRNYADTLHIATTDFVGKDDIDLGFPPELVKGDPVRGIRGFWADDRQVMDTGERLLNPHDPATVDGEEHVFYTVKTPVRDADGKIWAVLGLAQDVTRVSHVESALKASLHQQEDLIRSQQELILELSTPLIPVHDGVVVMPIIGVVDDARAKQILETLLGGVGQHGARTAILDITGVKSVDTHVAQALIQAAQAAQLLGTEVILTGISAGVAQTLVNLGVDLRGIDTQSTLQRGIARSLSRKRRQASA